jgi:predicted nucleotidyltransferase
MDKQIILNDLTQILKQKFGDAIDRVILFGSRVDGSAMAWSDYDVLVILNEDYDYKREWDIYDTCYEINLKYDILIDAKIISTNELQSIKGKQPFIETALETGVSV